MKFKTIFLSALLLGFAFTLGNCKKEEPTPNTSTGGLAIKVQLAGSTDFVQGAVVGIANSLDNFDNSIYLSEKTTNATGKVDFGQLKSGTYYYDVYYQLGITEYYTEGQIQVVAGKNKEIVEVLE